MDIKDRYSIELDEIRNYLTDLEREHIYELTKIPGTPSCATLAQHLKEDIAALLDLIENNKPGVAEKVAEVSKKFIAEKEHYYGTSSRKNLYYCRYLCSA